MKHLKRYEKFDPFADDEWFDEETEGITLKEFMNKHKWLFTKLKNERSTFMSFSFDKLSDIIGIGELKSLKTLMVSYEKYLTTLDGIEKLTNLTDLSCENNQLTNIDHIKELKKLKYLHCNDNNLTNIDVIRGLPLLKQLKCINNNFSEEYKNELRVYCNNNDILLVI